MMLIYLLDTNILSELIRKRPNPHLIAQLSSKPPQSFFTSSICVMELRYGSMLRNDFINFWQRINQEILSRVSILSISEKEALQAGDILASLKKSGQIIGLEDILIAASVITHQCVMVTENTDHFKRINDLSVENWLESASD